VVVVSPAPTPAAVPAPVVTRIELSGTAATGAAMTGARVRVVDARGQAVGRSAAVGADGRYTVTLDDGARAPFVLTAEWEQGEAQVSIVDRVEGASATVNVTPITSLIAARLSPTGTPQGLVQRFEQAAATPSVELPSAASIQAKKEEVLRVIEPVRQALGDRTDPVSGNFSVGGTGHDKLLDSVTVTITPKSENSTNIELTVRTKRDDETPLPAVSFASNAASSDLRPVPPIQRADLGDEGTSAKIDAFVAELNRCYALPVSDRVTSTTTTPRTAALVKAGLCKDMYYNADPALFLDNGAVVGNGAGGGLFAADTLVFDRPVYEYTRRAIQGSSPEMVVFTVRWTNQTSKATDTIAVHTRADATGALKLYGNQYRHPMSVRPIVIRQNHLRADSAHMDNVRVGYNLIVADPEVNGQRRYDRVVVQAPVGLEAGATRDEFVLRPIAGFTNLRMTGLFSPTRSSNVVLLGGGFLASGTDANTASSRMRARQVSSGTTSSVTHPIELDAGGAVWIHRDTPWTDERIERLSHKSVWTFRFFLRGNTSDQPDAVQSMTTISRVPSVREARQVQLAALTQTSRNWLRERSMEPDANLFWLSARPDATGVRPTSPHRVSLSWEVPSAAVAPTSVNVYGRTTQTYETPWELRIPFDRFKSVSSATRTVEIDCNRSLTISATLCDPTDPTLFSLRTMLTEFELWGKDARQVELSQLYGSFIPKIRGTSTLLNR
jgi:hypothetical protein